MAADLQRRHQLEGAPDPFPELVADSSSSSVQQTTQAKFDPDSQSAFPSLSSNTSGNGTQQTSQSAWGSAGKGPRIKPTSQKQPVFSDSFDLTAIDLTSSGKDGRPTSLGEIMKQVMAKFKVKIEASGNQRSRQTTFHLKAESPRELEKAKRQLLGLVSPKVTVVINAPASTIAAIIGPKGANLKHIRDNTGVRVDIPPRESIPANGDQTNGLSSGKGSPLPDDEDEEEATVPVTLSGPQHFVLEAQAALNQIISSKTSRTTQRVRNIAPQVLPFVTANRPAFMSAAAGGDVQLTLKAPEREIVVSGERETVNRVVEAIKATISATEASITPVKLTLPKRQHRLLAGKAVDEILAEARCSFTLPDADDPSEEVTVWGEGNKLPSGLGAVMTKANSQYIHEFFIPGNADGSRQILAYLEHIDYLKKIQGTHPDTSLFVTKTPKISIDIVGEKANVDAVVKQLSEFLGRLIGGTKEVSIDWLIHRVIIGKNAKKLKTFTDVHHIIVIFPAENLEQSKVLLIYDPSTTALPQEKVKHLDEVEKELLKMAKDAADVKSELVTVEKRWHDAILGHGRTTLNAIIGEDTTLSIKLGKEAGEASEDVILVRGAASDVDRVVKDIREIVVKAQNDEIDNSFSLEFDIDREFVGRVVGAQGAGVNKLRDQLGVKVDLSDDVDEKEKDSGKKKKVVHQKTRVKITGRKENVEDAKKRILAQLEKLADETSEILKIPNQYHSSLIGQSGKYVTRLEEKYSVKITFPRHSADNENKTREQLKPDEVLVKGGKKGVAGAKSELLDALEFEKESNNVVKFSVPSRSVARILGKGGASINEIKDNTDAQIDVDKFGDDSSITTITVRGTKKATAAAKAAVLAIAEQVSEETTVTVSVESKYHRTLIGPGGQGLKDLVVRCGGPSDPKQQAGLIHFPRQGEPSDEVRLRGEPKLVKALQAELEKVVATLRDRVVLAVDIPAPQHRNLIGRGGQHLNDLQSKHGVQIQFPGSRTYGHMGEAENVGELADVDPANLVKIAGPRAACEAALQELKNKVKAPAPEEISETISIPLKYQHSVAQQGALFRNLRNFGVQVDQPEYPRRPSPPSRPSPVLDENARIDAEETTEEVPEVQWQVISNYQNAEEGDVTWTLKAKDRPALERAQKVIQDAIDHAEKMTHVGFLTLSDRSIFPRIVGTRGANVARLREETGADIVVGRDNNTITITGSESAILVAKDAILRISSNAGRSQHRYD